MPAKQLYGKNPDVVLRKEKEEGGFLYNPDTNQIKVLNTTGLFVWHLCDGLHSLDDIVQGVKDNFEDVPSEHVATQISSFLNELMTSQFVGVVEARNT